MLDTLIEHWKKIINRWWHIIDTTFSLLPQKISSTTEQVFSAKTANQLSESLEDIKKHFSSLFESIKEEDTINLASEDIPCAIIANIVYNDPFSRPREIWSYTLIEAHNSIEYCLYRDAIKWKCILWFRWTEMTEAKDYLADLNIILWTHAFIERFQDSITIYDTMCNEYPDDIKMITWHSLGGTICYLIAEKKDPDRTVVFNPWSSVNPTFAHMLADTQLQKSWTKRVFTYRILWDVVSTLSIIGYTRTFRKASVNPLELHAAANFLPHDYVISQTNQISN